MRLITKDFVRTALIADPSTNDLVEALEIQLRFGASVTAGAVAQIKGGLHVTDAVSPGRLHLIDEENISGIVVTLKEAEASEVGVHNVAKLIRWAEKQGRAA